MPRGEVFVQTSPHPNPKGRWITFPITVAGIQTLSAVLDTGAPASLISPATEADLIARNLLHQPSDPQYKYQLTDLTVEGQPLPDLEVVVWRGLTIRQIEVLVGLNYLREFVSITFHVPTLRLTLTDP